MQGVQVSRAKSEERMDVRNNESASRYELEVDRGIAVATYRLKRNVITFIHTEVPPTYGARGLPPSHRGRPRRCARAWLEISHDVSVRHLICRAPSGGA